MNKYILGKEQKRAFDSCIEWAKRVLFLLPSEKETDKVTLGLNKINEYVLSNTHRFRPECSQGRVGWFNNGNVHFYPEEFKILLKEWDIPANRFYKEIKEMGVTLLDDNNRFKAIKHGNRTIRAVTFTNIDINILIENVHEYR